MSSDRIRIDTEKLEDIASQLSQLSSALSSLSLGITGIAATASQVVSEQPGIIRNINSLKTRVSYSSQYAQRLSGAVFRASAVWAEAEEKATCQNEAGEDPFGDGGGDSSKGVWDYLAGAFKDAIGGTGALGGVLSAVWSCFDGSVETGKDWGKIGADLLEAGGNLVMDRLEGVSWAEAVFGIGEYTKTAGEAFTKGMSNPVSWVVNTVKSGIDNFQYAQDGNAARFITETAAEAAVNVALGAGSVALVAAGVAAAGATAPVWVVGAAGAVIVYGVNAASEAFLGDNLANSAGNAVGDFTDSAAVWFSDTGAKLRASAEDCAGAWSEFVFAA